MITLREMAEKILKDWGTPFMMGVSHEDAVLAVIALLREVVDKADTKGQVKGFDKGHRRGWEEAIEEAAKVAEKNVCGLDVCSTEVAERVRALKRSEGEGK